MRRVRVRGVGYCDGEEAVIEEHETGAAAGPAPRLVTLTTDFGTRDSYAAAMKGVMLAICPELRLHDLSHEIAAQDILEGAFFLAGAVPHFPTGTVHLVVVDPGVGTDRRPIAVLLGGQIVVCPDNGLLTLLTRKLDVDEARVITNPRFRRDEMSATFHGRDLFAPAAARLACSEAFSDVGPVAEGLVKLDVPAPSRDAGDIRGEVIHVDRFGNAVTNIDRAAIGDATVTEVRAGEHAWSGLRRTYDDVAAGESLALFESSGYLAIAVNRGNASTVRGIRRGHPVDVDIA